MTLARLAPVREEGAADPAARIAWHQRLCTLVQRTPGAPGLEPEAVHAALVALEPQEGPATWRVHRFEPQGVSVLGFGSRLRVVFHTWPEHGLATLDVAGCDPGALDALLGGLCARLDLEPHAEVGLSREGPHPGPGRE